ncbi:MAG: Rpn family recombination-promoting nuclease/putative transposase [Micrococcales bacterium]|nr:Rpn family recombination-promoting nuclease/putative transposase [Micrococcales bacterium]
MADSVPLHYDSVFRWVFGNPHHVPALATLLRAAMPEVPSKEWSKLALPSPHLLRDAPGNAEAVLDLHVTTASIASLDVELQWSWVPAARERFTYYNAKQLAAQLAIGQQYTTLRPVVTLAICGFVLIGEDRHYRHTFVDYDVDHQVRFTNIRQLRTLEIPKLPAHDDGTDLWDWMRLIAAKTEEDIDMAAERNADVADAAVLVREFSADEDRRYEALAREKFLRDQATREAWGRQQGLEQGRAEGRAEVARNALGMGMSVDQVCTLTGLSPSDVDRLTVEP